MSRTDEGNAAEVGRGAAAILEPPAEWGVGDDVPLETFDGIDPGVLLDELEKHERLTAWLVARGVAIIEQLARAREAEAIDDLDRREPDASPRRRNLVRAEARACIEDEVALATGLSFGVAHARTRLALDEQERSAPVRHAMAAGQMSWQRAWHVTGTTQDVPAVAISGIVDKLVAPYPARSVHGQGGLLVPQQVFTSRLRYQLAKVLARAEQHASNLAARSVTATVDAEFGTGELRVTGHAARIIGAHERVDAIARTLRRDGDRRTLHQLRSDITLDLILHGQIPAAAAPSLLASPDAAATTDVSFDPASFDGVLPPAHVDVVVPLTVLMGASDEPGMLTCGDEQHWLAAAFVRDIAFAAGSTWRRLVTDPVTGHLRDLTVAGYAITGELRERIIARDRISRAPGRLRPARRCDTDHDVDHALGGPSSESNVSAKDRRGHNHKTRHSWRSTRSLGTTGIDGEIVWTTPTGRRYATLPWDYRDPDPPTAEHLRVTFLRNHPRPAKSRPEAAGAPPSRPRDVDGLHGYDHSEFEHQLALLLDDHHTTGVHRARPRPDRPKPQPPTPWDRKDPVRRRSDASGLLLVSPRDDENVWEATR